MLIQLLRTSISSALPISTAALGASFTHMLGKLNIAVEGTMLWACFVSVYVADRLNSWLLGLLAALISSCILSLSVWSLHRYFRANIFVVGLGMNVLISGLVVLLSSTLLGSRGTIFFEKIPQLPVLRLSSSRSDGIDALLSEYNVLELIAILAVLFSWIVVKTPFGLRMKAVGKNESVAKQLGVNVDTIAASSFILCGLYCGMAGSLLALPLGLFVSGMTNNRGWLALVAAVLGGDSPLGVFGVSLILGFAVALSHRLQLQTNVPSEIAFSVPMILTLFVALIYNALTKSRKRG